MNGGRNLNNKYLQLDYIINVNNFQRIQDSIAEATEMAVLTVDYKGNPVTKHSRCSDFCKKARAHADYGQLCKKCDSRGGLEAARLQKPYIYICHMGLLDFAIPIIVNEQYIGAVMAGQILVEDTEKEYLEQIVSGRSCKIDLLESDNYRELYKKIPLVSLDRVKAVADMMYHISNYIVEEALLKINLIEQNNSIFSLCALKYTNEEYRKSFGESKEQLKYDNNDNVLKAKGDEIIEVNQRAVNRVLGKSNIILKPALEYIQHNYNKTISLDEVAAICNISTSYFSKLFKKIVGENFSNYVNKIRINEAKLLLETTDTPITNISLDLGFDDCGYFIKVFKKQEGVTPSVYRSQYFAAV